MMVPKLSRKHAILLTICFGLGCFTRLTGLGHGTAENFPTDDTTGFQRFHPDEEMLIRSALVLKSPLQPPQTNYGMLPLYLLRVSYESACTVSGLDIDDLSVASNPRLLFGIARVLSAVLSCAALVLVGLMALRYLGATAACLALFFVAMSPAAVQQAHFYTVDGLFTLMSLSALYCCLRALENRSVGWYLATGILVGFAGAVRLNGLALGAIPLAGLLIRYHWRSLYTKDLWIVAGASIAAVLVLQPYLVTGAESLMRAENTEDFLFALKIARGEILRPWTLVDVNTTPFLYQWTDLLPLASGTPLTLAFAAGLFYAVWKHRFPHVLILLWFAIYFVSVGSFHTKYVRYLLPTLPLLSLLTADLGAAAIRSARFGLYGFALSVAVLVYSGIYGISFSRLYNVEDSRISAARWIAANLPSGSTIGTEGGAFSMRPLIDADRYRLVPLKVHTLFNSQGYTTCAYSLDLLHDHVAAMEHLAIVEVNRSQQYRAVPELFPAVSAFYTGLAEQSLGFQLVQRFRNYPNWLGFEFNDDGAEPSFTSYDHPTVLIFQRADPPVFERAWTRWQSALTQSGDCADGEIRAADAQVSRGDLPRARETVHRLLSRHPDNKIAHFIDAEIYRRENDSLRAAIAMASYLSPPRKGLERYLIPCFAAWVLQAWTSPSLQLPFCGMALRWPTG